MNDITGENKDWIFLKLIPLEDGRIQSTQDSNLKRILEQQLL